MIPDESSLLHEAGASPTDRQTSMSRTKPFVSERRRYAVLDVKAAKSITHGWLGQAQLTRAVQLGLPEVDDRYHYWRVPLLARQSRTRIGEVVIDAQTSLVVEGKSTSTRVLEARLLGRGEPAGAEPKPRESRPIAVSNVRNTIALGDSEDVIPELPAESVGLVFTSPPYYNARPEYSDFVSYEDYLLKLRKVIQAVHRVLAEGRFFVINVSPVLVRRNTRSESSRRIAVPFDLHRVFTEEGYEFIDDIIWVKPEGAGWATGRGRRFAADRNPLQYKPVPVTEYVLVYRKQTDKLIDWSIRNHPSQDLVKASKIGDDYERTNVWRIKPSHDRRHPAVFPVELAEKVIRYYSFREDVILDPFAGIGTTGRAAVKLGRRFVLIEKNPEYIAAMRDDAASWLGKEIGDVLTLNCDPMDPSGAMF